MSIDLEPRASQAVTDSAPASNTGTEKCASELVIPAALTSTVQRHIQAGRRRLLLSTTVGAPLLEIIVTLPTSAIRTLRVLDAVDAVAESTSDYVMVDVMPPLVISRAP